MRNLKELEDYNLDLFIEHAANGHFYFVISDATYESVENPKNRKDLLEIIENKEGISYLDLRHMDTSLDSIQSTILGNINDHLKCVLVFSFEQWNGINFHFNSCNSGVTFTTVKKIEYSIGESVTTFADFADLRKEWGYPYPKIGEVLTIERVEDHPDQECKDNGIVLLQFKEKPGLCGVCNKNMNHQLSFVKIKTI